MEAMRLIFIKLLSFFLNLTLFKSDIGPGTKGKVKLIYIWVHWRQTIIYISEGSQFEKNWDQTQIPHLHKQPHQLLPRPLLLG